MAENLNYEIKNQKSRTSFINAKSSEQYSNRKVLNPIQLNRSPTSAGGGGMGGGAALVPNTNNLTFRNRNQGKSWCYDNAPENCDKYGRLYNWEAANSVCPSGWHLPTSKEWNILIDDTGGASITSPKLIAKNSWNVFPNGTDEYDFSALPGGFRGEDEKFYGIGLNGFWWSANKTNPFYLGVQMSFEHDKLSAISVRCVKDPPPPFLSLSIRVGINGSLISESYKDVNGKNSESYSEPVFGYQIGLLLDKTLLGDWFHFQSGIVFITKGGSIRSENLRNKSFNSIDLYYLKFPALASFKFPFDRKGAFRLNAGPYFSWRFDDNRKDLYKSDFIWEGFAFESGLDLSEYFYMGIFYDYGLRNINKKDYFETHNHTLGFNLGFNWGFR
jgi:uncharacterized protein (TIGR02145 family)